MRPSWILLCALCVAYATASTRHKFNREAVDKENNVPDKTELSGSGVEALMQSSGEVQMPSEDRPIKHKKKPKYAKIDEDVDDKESPKKKKKRKQKRKHDQDVTDASPHNVDNLVELLKDKTCARCGLCLERALLVYERTLPDVADDKPVEGGSEDADNDIPQRKRYVPRRDDDRHEEPIRSDRANPRKKAHRRFKANIPTETKDASLVNTEDGLNASRSDEATETVTSITKLKIADLKSEILQVTETVRRRWSGNNTETLEQTVSSCHLYQVTKLLPCDAPEASRLRGAAEAPLAPPASPTEEADTERALSQQLLKTVANQNDGSADESFATTK